MNRPLTLRDTRRLLSRGKVGLQRNNADKTTCVCINTTVKGEHSHICEGIDFLWRKPELQSNLDRWITKAGPNADLSEFIKNKHTHTKDLNAEDLAKAEDADPNDPEQSQCNKEFEIPEPTRKENKQTFKSKANSGKSSDNNKTNGPNDGRNEIEKNNRVFQNDGSQQNQGNNCQSGQQQQGDGQQQSSAGQGQPDPSQGGERTMKGGAGQQKNSPQGGSSSNDGSKSGRGQTSKDGSANGGETAGGKPSERLGTKVVNGDVKSSSSPKPQGKGQNQELEARAGKSQPTGSEKAEMGPRREGIEPTLGNELLQEIGKLLAGDSSSTGTGMGAVPPSHSLNKIPMVPISLEARHTSGGNYLNVESAELRSKEERKLAREIYVYLKRLLERKISTFGEQSPRWDHKKLVKELVSKSGSLVRCRKQEITHEMIIVMSDVSGSCASTCNATMAACFAIAEQDDRILVVAHSNGQPVELFGHKAKTYQKHFQKLTEIGESDFGALPAAWKKLFSQLPPVAGVLAMGDHDAVNSYRAMCEYPAKFFWLDPWDVDYHQRRDKSARDVRPYPKESAEKTYHGWKVKPIIHMCGVIDANTAAIALKKMSKTGTIYDHESKTT